MMPEGLERVFERIQEIQTQFFRPLRKSVYTRSFQQQIERAQEQLFDSNGLLNGKSSRFNITDFDHIIKRAADRYNIPERLIKSIIKQESNFNPYAISNKGAKGLMQIMPETARLLGIKDIFNPEENIEGGVKYLRMMLDRFGGDLVKALAAYNAGPEAVERYNGVPDYTETKNYIRNILNYLNMF